jgi:hypothetical protein
MMSCWAPCKSHSMDASLKLAAMQVWRLRHFEAHCIIFLDSCTSLIGTVLFNWYPVQILNFVSSYDIKSVLVVCVTKYFVHDVILESTFDIRTNMYDFIAPLLFLIIIALQVVKVSKKSFYCDSTTFSLKLLIWQIPDKYRLYFLVSYNKGTSLKLLVHKNIIFG